MGFLFVCCVSCMSTFASASSELSAQKTRSSCAGWLCTSAICLIIFGFAVSLVAIWTASVTKTSSATSVDCKLPSQGINSTLFTQSHPRVSLGNESVRTTYFELKPSLLSAWNWRFETRSMRGSGAQPRLTAEQICPSSNHDSLVFGESNLRTDAKTWTAHETLHIRDCHGSILWTVSSGSLAQTLWNGNKLYTSLQLRDRNNKLLAYISQTEAISLLTYITFISASDGSVVASAERDSLHPLQGWRITISNPDAEDCPIVNPAVLSALVSHFAFASASAGNNSGSDGCNQYFFFVTVVLLVVCCLGTFFVVCILLAWMKTRRKPVWTSVPDHEQTQAQTAVQASAGFAEVDADLDSSVVVELALGVTADLDTETTAERF